MSQAREQRNGRRVIATHTRADLSEAVCEEAKPPRCLGVHLIGAVIEAIARLGGDIQPIFAEGHCLDLASISCRDYIRRESPFG